MGEASLARLKPTADLEFLDAGGAEDRKLRPRHRFKRPDFRRQLAFKRRRIDDAVFEGCTGGQAGHDQNRYDTRLAGAALWLSARAGRPSADTRVPLAALAAVVGLAMLWGAVEIVAAPGDERLADWLGRTWTICGRNILLVSAAAAVPTFLSARKLAPTRPAFSGFALGVATGGIAATAYGVLHCPESTAAFVATWYTLGVAGAGLIGAVAGRFALRW